MVAVVYVDDILLYPKSDVAIHDLSTQFKTDAIWIHLEGTAEGFIGVAVSCCKKPPGLQITLTQECLTNCISRLFV